MVLNNFLFTSSSVLRFQGDSTFSKNQSMHFESRSLHGPSDSAVKKERKKDCPACWKPCPVELVDLQSKRIKRYPKSTVLYLSVKQYKTGFKGVTGKW